MLTKRRKKTLIGPIIFILFIPKKIRTKRNYVNLLIYFDYLRIQNFFLLWIERERERKKKLYSENWMDIKTIKERKKWKLHQNKKKEVLLPRNWTPFHFKIHDFCFSLTTSLSTCGCRWCAISNVHLTMQSKIMKIQSILFYCWLTNNFINCLAIYFDIFFSFSRHITIKRSIDLVIIERVRTQQRKANWKDLNLHAFAITIGILQSNLIPSRKCSKYRLWRWIRK